MWRPGERRADDCKFAFYLSRGPDFRKRTGDISPPGEVLSRDGKYPKIPGSVDPDPGARLENGLNLFGAGMNLGPLRPPPAAARAGQIRWSFFPNIAPLVCLAFSALLGAFSLFRRAR